MMNAKTLFVLDDYDGPLVEWIDGTVPGYLLDKNTKLTLNDKDYHTSFRQLEIKDNTLICRIIVREANNIQPRNVS